MLLCTLGIYLFFAQIWSIHLASEHLDHLVTHTVAVFNDFTTSVSVSSFQFCLNCFPKYQVNHQFPHPPLSFCSSADTRWWRRQWYTSMHWEKATFNSDLTVLIHVAWPLLRYVSKLRPCKKKKKKPGSGLIWIFDQIFLSTQFWKKFDRGGHVIAENWTSGN